MVDGGATDWCELLVQRKEINRFELSLRATLILDSHRGCTVQTVRVGRHGKGLDGMARGRFALRGRADIAQPRQ